MASIFDNMKEYYIEATFTDNVLGCSPLDPFVMEKYIASRIYDKENPYDSEEAKRRFEKEIQSVANHPFNNEDGDDDDNKKEQSITIFKRSDDGTPYFEDYTIKGFFKEATSILKTMPGTASSKVKAYKKYVDGRIFVYGEDGGDEIRIKCVNKFSDGKYINFCQRSLRASTAKGDRIALAVSEMIKAGAVIRFKVVLLDKSDEAWLKEMLEYGQLKGLGQWRNSGMGRFTVKYLDSFDD